MMLLYLLKLLTVGSAMYDQMITLDESLNLLLILASIQSKLSIVDIDRVRIKTIINMFISILY